MLQQDKDTTMDGESGGARSTASRTSDIEIPLDGESLVEEKPDRDIDPTATGSIPKRTGFLGTIRDVIRSKKKSVNFEEEKNKLLIEKEKRLGNERGERFRIQSKANYQRLRGEGEAQLSAFRTLFNESQKKETISNLMVPRDIYDEVRVDSIIPPTTTTNLGATLGRAAKYNAEHGLSDAPGPSVELPDQYDRALYTDEVRRSVIDQIREKLRETDARDQHMRDSYEKAIIAERLTYNEKAERGTATETDYILYKKRLSYLRDLKRSLPDINEAHIDKLNMELDKHQHALSHDVTVRNLDLDKSLDIDAKINMTNHLGVLGQSTRERWAQIPDLLNDNDGKRIHLDATKESKTDKLFKDGYDNVQHNNTDAKGMPERSRRPRPR